jgi:8-oxo-dGTP pyrophosphatase MutT (NUDIX family)
MSIYNHNIYDNIRTRVIVLHEQQVLLLPRRGEEDGWRLPGGGLEPDESLFECGVREVFEETGLTVHVTGVAFLREWVVPKYATLPEQGDGAGFGLEVYLYAEPVLPLNAPRAEGPTDPLPQWVALSRLPTLPLWPKHLKTFASLLLAGKPVYSVPSFVDTLESPATPGPEGQFNRLPRF